MFSHVHSVLSFIFNLPSAHQSPGVGKVSIINISSVVSDIRDKSKKLKIIALHVKMTGENQCVCVLKYYWHYSRKYYINWFSLRSKPKGLKFKSKSQKLKNHFVWDVISWNYRETYNSYEIITLYNKGRKLNSGEVLGHTIQQ